MPDRLYKYESMSTQALRNLKKQILYFGPPINFNDPYDCALTPNIVTPTDEDIDKVRKHYLDKPDTPIATVNDLTSKSADELRAILLRNAAELMKTTTEDFLHNKGVSCFSEVNDDLLMWSHYGGRYRGFCLEFDASLGPFSRAKQVKYVSELPRLEPVKLLFDSDWNIVEYLFCTKSESWAYEKEWRCIHQEAGTQFTYPLESLTGVFFGPDIEFESLEIICLILRGQNPNVRLWRGTRSTTEFRVLFEPFEYMSYAEAKDKGLR